MFSRRRHPLPQRTRRPSLSPVFVTGFRIPFSLRNRARPLGPQPRSDATVVETQPPIGRYAIGPGIHAWQYQARLWLPLLWTALQCCGVRQPQYALRCREPEPSIPSCPFLPNKSPKVEYVAIVRLRGKPGKPYRARTRTESK